MINLVVGGDGLLPADQASAEYLDGCKLGQVIACKPSKVRNYQFHKKYFALLKVAFELWEPPYQKSELLEGRFGKPAFAIERCTGGCLDGAGVVNSSACHIRYLN